MTEFMGLAEKVSKFNQEAMKHLERQTLNPFSGRFSRSPSPRPKFSKEEYGKPAAGSKTEARGQRAFTQISKEVLELCEVIHDMGARRRDSDGDECIIIPFGELFAFYTKISDKVVGLLIAAKKRGFVWFEPEILFQRRDDDVLIALLKPIGEIRNTINRAISASPSPAPAVSSDTEKSPSGTSTPSTLSRQNSNSSFDTSFTTEKSEHSPTPATFEKEPAASSVENKPQESSSTQAVDLVQTASTPGALFPVEEEQTSSEAPVVESKPEPTLEAATEAESSSTVVPEPTVAEKENAETKEETVPSEDQRSAEIAATSEETALPTVTSEEVVLATATSEEAVSSTATSEEVAPTIVTSEETAPTTATSDETVPPTTTPEEEHTSEPAETSTEKVLKIEPIAASEDQESLTLKIIVEVEPGQVPSTPTLAEPEVESSPALEQNSSSSKVPVEEETSTSALEVAPGDNEQTSSSSAATIEPEAALSSSNKSEVVIPPEEQTPPSNDTGEKTLA